jgi:CRISPR/Cas system CMR-associated protein Cmr1 (group 7 of RAMP superfamily)
LPNVLVGVELIGLSLLNKLVRTEVVCALVDLGQMISEFLDESFKLKQPIFIVIKEFVHFLTFHVTKFAAFVKYALNFVT